MAQTSVTIVAGLNESYFSQPNLNTSTNTSTTSDRRSNRLRSGIQVGALLNVDIGNITIQPGLMYSVKGNYGTDDYTYTGWANNNYYNNSITKERIGYLQLPVNILYNIKLKKNIKLFMGGGPYIAYGIWGKSHESIYYGGSAGTGISPSTYDYDYNLSFGNNAGNIKNPDAGVNLMVGIKLKKRFSFSANYGIGITSLATPQVPVYYNAFAPAPTSSSISQPG